MIMMIYSYYQKTYVFSNKGTKLYEVNSVVSGLKVVRLPPCTRARVKSSRALEVFKF